MHIAHRHGQAAGDPPHRDTAIALSEAGQHLAAIAAFETRLHALPGSAEACIDLATALIAGARVADAANLLGARCGDHAHQPGYLKLYGRVLVQHGQPAAAIGALLMALEMDPADTRTQAALGLAFFEAGDDGQAVAHCAEAWRRSMGGEEAVAFTKVLMITGAYQDALTVTTATLPSHPSLFELLRNHAAALDGLGRYAEAIQVYRHNAAINADKPFAHLSLAMALLHDGQLSAEAWRLYEARHAVRRARLRPPGAPWDGSDPAGRTILLTAEQGLGDTIQFIRYAPLVKARGARVVVQVQAALEKLLRGAPGVDQIVPVGAALPPYDAHASLVSLPFLFGTTLDSIPPPLAIASTHGTERPAALQVGLVWCGSPIYVEDKVRSVPLADLAPFAGVANVQFHSLQHGAAALPAIPGMIDAMPGVVDFTGTAALIAGLDLVIAVDTSVAHLAATMGKPVWLLTRLRGCWRWMHSRHDTPWYPTMRLIRQSRAARWETEIATVCQALQTLARSGPHHRSPACFFADALFRPPTSTQPRYAA